jgi:putative DNA primase/helicase
MIDADNTEQDHSIDNALEAAVLEAAKDQASLPDVKVRVAATPSKKGPMKENRVAIEFSKHVRGTVRYVPEWKSYMVWNGSVWARDRDGIDVEAVFREYTCSPAAPLCVYQAQNYRQIRSAVSMLKSDASLRAQPADFDADNFILNTPSGVLFLTETDLSSGTVKQVPHDPKFMCSRITKTAYNPSATCPTWDAFCVSSAARQDGSADPDLAAYRQRRRGSYLSGNPDKVLEIAFDQRDDGDSSHDRKPGNSGKTTAASTMAKVMGTYADKVHKSCFVRSRNEQHPTNLAELEGLRFAYGAEIKEALDLEQVKDLTGEPQLKARKMHQDMRSFDRHCKYLIYSNDRPSVGKSESDPIWNRVHADGWFKQIEKPMPETEIYATYEREAEGIFAYMVRGWIEYYARKMRLDPPEAILLANRNYQESENPLASFLVECCDVGPGFTVRFCDLWAKRQEWSKKSKERERESARSFGMLLTSCGFSAGKSNTHDKSAIRRGLKLNGAPSPKSPEEAAAEEKGAEAVLDVSFPDDDDRTEADKARADKLLADKLILDV